MNNSNYTRLILLLLLVSSAFSRIDAQEKDHLRISQIPHELFWQNNPQHFKATPNGFLITAGEKTDMFRDPNVTYNTDTAPKLLFKSDSDFVLIASIEHAFANKWDGGALVVIQDSLNWIKFCFEKDYTGAKRVVSVVTKTISDDCNSVEIKGNSVFYKIAKAGNVITLYYSTTGANWYLVRHLQFADTKDLQVGFLAQSPTGKKCAVQFSHITYSTKRIKDPYTGE